VPGNLPDLSTREPGSSAAAVWDGPVNGVAFQLVIPRLNYRATVYEGVGSAQLEQGPGHYPESAWPGQPGNVAVAAHNVYWLSFSQLRAGDRVEIRTRHHVFEYEITGSRVVGPDDRSALAQTPEHRLTLTTCYPLWAGEWATQRLIFTARAIEGQP
jgi:sortase A